LLDKLQQTTVEVNVKHLQKAQVRLVLLVSNGLSVITSIKWAGNAVH